MKAAWARRIAFMLIGILAIGIGVMATGGVANADGPRWQDDWKRWESEKRDHHNFKDDKFKHDDKKHEMRFEFDKKEFDQKEFDRRHFDQRVVFVKIVVIQVITIEHARIALNVDELIFKAAHVMGLHPQFVWWQLSQGFSLAGLAFHHGIARIFLIQGLLVFDRDLWPFIDTLLDRTDLLAHSSIRF
jgi:hypothetical protein